MRHLHIFRNIGFAAAMLRNSFMRKKKKMPNSMIPLVSSEFHAKLKFARSSRKTEFHFQLQRDRISSAEDSVFNWNWR